jgi:hypothetical protein
MTENQTRHSTADETARGNGTDSEARGSEQSFLETVVYADESVAAVCQHCGRPFSSEQARDLHVGETHETAATDAEMATFEDAEENERDDLFYFHLRVVAALGVLYGVLVLVYMAALGSGLL